MEPMDPSIKKNENKLNRIAGGERPAQADQQMETVTASNDADQSLAFQRSTPPAMWMQAERLNSTGTSLLRAGRYDEALTAFRQVLELYRQLPDSQRQQADNLFNAGLALREMNRYGEALTVYRQAVELYRHVPGTACSTPAAS